MEEVKCLLCDSKGNIFWKENNYTGRKCDQDNIIFISPRLSEKENILLYNEDSFFDQISSAGLSYGKILSARKVLKIITNYKQSGKFLEIGAGAGHTVKLAKDTGFTGFALESSKRLCDKLREELEIEAINCRAEDDFFKEEKFDVIYHKDVLSHLYDPVKVFKNIHEKLLPDGILVFETGNLGGVNKFWLKYIGALGFPEHLYLFSHKSVCKILETTGFKLIKHSTHTVIYYRMFEKILNLFRIRKSVNRKYSTRKRKRSFFRSFKGYIAYFLEYKVGKLFFGNIPSKIIYIAKKDNL